MPEARHQAAVRRPEASRTPTTTPASLQARRACSGAARAATQPANSVVSANTLVPPRRYCGGVATAIVPGGRGLSQASNPRTAVSSSKVLRHVKAPAKPYCRRTMEVHLPREKGDLLPE